MAGRQPGTLIGAIEGGGTKFVCAVAHTPTVPLERMVVATRDPAATLRDCTEFFRAAAIRHGTLGALGVACFGPLELRTHVPVYGCLLATPKPGWSGVDVLGPLRVLGVPIALDTDVAAAARGELDAGAGRGRKSLAYVTVGTGIGGAVAPVNAPRRMHAEMGHLIVRRDASDEGFVGVCPFHRDCLEGLASGPAIRARWGCDLSALPAMHPGRAIVAGYIAQLAVAIALLHAPDVLVIGGGVMADDSLLPQLRKQAHWLLGDYLPHLKDQGGMEDFISAPHLGSDSAIVGALLMARATIEENAETSAEK